MIDVVIPSKNMSNLGPCLEAIGEHEPAAGLHLIIVDDGLEWPHPSVMYDQKFSIVTGEKPFIFARNINIGMRAARPGAYVVLLNDDALLTSPGGFSTMAEEMTNCPQFGIVSSTTNLAGNPQQWRQTQNVGTRLIRSVKNIQGHSAPVVAFVCVMISPACIEKIGLLDERFNKYGFEDNDYCRRAANAGLDIGVFDDCYVDHGKLTSTFRGAPNKAGDIMPAWQIYLEKWGTL